MGNLYDTLTACLTDQLIQAVLSAARKKDGPSRVKIRPVLHKGSLLFQTAAQVEKQQFHENLEKEAAISKITEWLMNDFGQLQLDLTDRTVSVLTSKKGKVTIKEKRKPIKMRPADLSHNRKKRYILEEGTPVPFLVDLGVMTPEGKIVHSKYDKFRQINRFLEFVEDILPALPKDREVVILDFGCGKSYLTFAMYYYLHELKGYDIRIIGLDLKEDVIRHCNELRTRYGYEKLDFLTGDIADYDGVDQVDMVVTLHACDTATDFALDKAIRWNAKVILSVPCCQHELNRQISNEILAPAFKYGLIQERMAALFTDAIRGNLLEEAGYQVQLLEFIDMEHTPKNILIRAVKHGKQGQHGKKEKQLHSDVQRMLEFLHVDPMLARLQDTVEEEKK